MKVSNFLKFNALDGQTEASRDEKSRQKVFFVWKATFFNKTNLLVSQQLTIDSGSKEKHCQQIYQMNLG